MPRSLNATFISEKNKRENKPIILYIIENYDGNNNDLTLAQYDADVVFDGTTYSKFPCKHEPIGENVQGRVDSMRITLANASRLIQGYLESYDGLKKKKVTIRTVFANQLADTDAYTDDIFYISSTSSNAKSATFTLTSRLDTLNVMIPRAIFHRNHCRYTRFKGTECGYAGAETECNRTKAQCKSYGNYARFGGFPSIPQSKIYVA